MLSVPKDSKAQASRPVPRQFGEHYLDLVERLAEGWVSRRGMLVGSLGVLTGVPLIGALARAAENFTCESTPGVTTLRIGGVPAWRIDTRWFDGRPQLHTVSSQQALSVRLSHALLPGTSMLADFVLNARRVEGRWQAQLHMTALNFASEFSLSTWLLGYERATSASALRHMVFHKAGDVRLEDLAGTTSFGPDWIWHTETHEPARLTVEGQPVQLDHLRWELATNAEAAENSQTEHAPSLRSWFGLARQSDLTLALDASSTVHFDTGSTQLSLTSARDGFHLLAQQQQVNALWSWAHSEPLQIPLENAKVELRCDVAGRHAVLSCDAMQPVWHVGSNLAAELVAIASDGVVRYTTEPSNPSAPQEQTAVGVRRFVVSLPGCDAATFVLRDASKGSPDTISYPADIRSLLQQRIPLDGYDLVLRRAADALALTVRFRHISLKFDGIFWCLVSHCAPGETSLIEYDFGSQHLMEQAVYISEWACVDSASCKPWPTKFRVSDEVAALAMLRAAAEQRYGELGSAPLPESEVQGPNGPVFLDTLLEKIYAKYPTACGVSSNAFDAFKQSDQLRMFLVGKDLKTRTRSLPARASYLTFDLGSSANLPLTANSLLAWSKAEPGLAALASAFRPVLTRRAAAVGQLPAVLNGENVDKPVIHRPLSINVQGAKDERLGTAIEVPSQVIMSPLMGQPLQWISPRAPRGLEHRGAMPVRYEVWSTRMQDVPLRAVFSPDANPCNPSFAQPPGTKPQQPDEIQVDIFNPPQPFAGDSKPGKNKFRTSTDGRDRHELVALTALYGYKTMSIDMAQPEGHFTPTPIQAKLLQLTSLGASFKYRGEWKPPVHRTQGKGALSVTHYSHAGQLGRDLQARVEYKGFLFPLGHPAVLIKLTERRLCLEGNQMVARLVQRFYIQVPAFVRRFPSVGQPLENRLWGHAAIAMAAFTTPDLEDPTAGLSCVLGQAAFWPRNLNQQYIEFDFEDPDAHVKYRAPLIFVDNHTANTTSELDKVFQHWRKETTDALYAAVGAWPKPTEVKRAFAHVCAARSPYIPGVATDNTDLETIVVLLGAQAPGDTRGYNDGKVEGPLGFTPAMLAQQQPSFYPTRRRAQIALSTVAAISGQPAVAVGDSTAPTHQFPWLIEYDRVYAVNGLSTAANADLPANPPKPTNAGQIYARFVDRAPTLNFGGDTSRSGGFASPSTALVWMSAKRGPVGGSVRDLVELGPPQIAVPFGIGIISTLGTQVTEVKNAHLGTMDAKEMFSAFLGDAKLLGLVRLADVLSIAVSAAGTQIPTIASSTLYDFAASALRKAIPVIQHALADALTQLAELPDCEAKTRLLRDTGQVNRDLGALYAAAESPEADAATLVARATLASQSMASIASDVSAIANKPEMLVPQKLLTLVEQLRLLQQQLARLDLSHLLKGPVRNAIQSYVDKVEALAQQTIKELVQQLVDSASPALAALQGRLLAIQADAQALKELAEDLEASVLDRLVTLILRADENLRVLGQQVALLRAATARPAELKDAVKEILFDKVLQAAFGVMKAAELDAWAKKADAMAAKFDSELDKLDQAVPGASIDDAQKAQARRLLVQARQHFNRLVQSMGDELQQFQQLVPANKQARQSYLRTPAKRNAKPVFPEPPSPEEIQLALLGAFAPRLITACGAMTDILALLRQYQSVMMNGAVTTNCDAVLRGLIDPFKDLLVTKLASLPQFNFDNMASQLIALHARIEAAQLPAGAVANLLDILKNAAAAFTMMAVSLKPGGAWELSLCDDAVNWQRDLAPYIQAAQELADGMQLLQCLYVRWNATAEELVQRAASLQAEVAAAKQKTETAIKDAGAAITNDVARVLASFITAVDDNLALVKGYLSDAVVDELTALRSDVATAVQDWKGVVKRVQALEAMAKRLAALVSPAKLAQLVNIDRLMRDAIAALGLPLGLRVTYDWNTQVNAFPDGDSAVFEPNPEGDRMLKIHAEVEAGVGQSARSKVTASLSEFNVNLFGKGPACFLTVKMSKLELVMQTGQELDCKCQVLDMEPGPALGFINEISALLGGQSGFRLLPTFRGVKVGYEFKKDHEVLGGFTIQNLSFSIFAEFPFDNSPVLVTMALADKINPFLISVGIYGGGGSLALRTRADTLEMLEASFEYGVVAALEFGVAKGSGRITAGVYIRLGGSNPVIQGFFCAVGSVSIAGLITVGASFRVSLTYEFNSNAMVGVAEYSFSFSIGFFDFSYAVLVEYVKEGGKRSEGANNQASLGGAMAVPGLAIVAATPAQEGAADASLDAWHTPQGWQAMQRFLQPAHGSTCQADQPTSCSPAIHLIT